MNPYEENDKQKTISEIQDWCLKKDLAIENHKDTIASPNAYIADTAKLELLCELEAHLRVLWDMKRTKKKTK